ncbi:MAG: DNA polymerase IV, partial [Oleibacter sp.]|nr:DNA polymerase IV [Thalassolituus sp.]
GAAPNKFIAKVASDWHKPNGQMIVPPEQVDEFVKALPVKKIHGVGPALQKRLQVVGIETCGDARAWELNELVRRFGRSGVHLYQRCRGIDERPITLHRERKSISVEHTYAQDLQGIQQCIQELPSLVQQWRQRVARTEWTPEALAPFVKLKFSDFSQTTLSDIREQASKEGFERLLLQALQRSDKPVRLIGLGGRFPQGSERQLALF